MVNRMDINDAECVDFLQYVLPRLRMCWPGFRRVRGQVCKRIARRIGGLGLSGFHAYRHYLDMQPREWALLDGLCRVTITRFYRDRQVFATLTGEVLPRLAEAACAEGRTSIRCWSIGSASGEEPYTLAILWQELFADDYPGLRLQVLATDADPVLIGRAHRACYPPSAVKNLPETLRNKAFRFSNNEYCLEAVYQGMVRFQQQDIRYVLPEGAFDLILCRNLVFTYFDESLQREILRQLNSRMINAGWLILGVHERLPSAQREFTVISERLGLYRKA